MCQDSIEAFPLVIQTSVIQAHTVGVLLTGKWFR